jgi:hypothetical protein
MCTLIFLSSLFLTIPLVPQTAGSPKVPASGPIKPSVGSNVSPAGEKSQTNDPPASLPSKLAGAIDASSDDNSDYIPCFFSRRELLSLRPQAESATLSSAEAEDLRSSVSAEALKPENSAAFTSGAPEEFASKIGQTQFEGLTRSQALSKVLSLLIPYTASPIIGALKQGGTAPGDFFESTYALPGTKPGEVSGEMNKALDGLTDLQDKLNALSSAAKTSTSINSNAQKDIEKAKTTLPESNAAKENLANAARANLAATRPLDIGCSMSILSYETTRKAFGETMADEYIGVQIVVRNVNPDREFLVQSAEFKVDDDINGRIGRYYSGVDKMTAREYMLASRDLGKRNLMVHIVQGTGAILSAAVPFTGPFMKQFSGVYSGGFAGALTTVFPDHNTEQLKLIDDEGFSNSRTDRTVVPKSGTAEFVIFISSKEFEEGWWTQDCAERIAIQSSGNLSPKKQAECVGTYNTSLPDPKCVDAQIGIDINAARRVCLAEHKSDPELLADPDNPALTYFKPKNVDYRKWSQQALAIFRELSLAVVAGTHVQEPSDTTPSLTKIECPVDDKGEVKLDAAKDGTISCTLAGTSLDKVAQLKLRNSQDATDTTTADGTTTTSGDSKSANVSFAMDKLCALNASTYKVYTVTKNGVEGGGDRLLHFDSTKPVLLAGPDPAQVDLSKLQAKDAKPIQITFKGCHLDKLTGVQLAGDLNSNINLDVLGKPTNTSATVSLGPVNINSKVKPKDYLTDPITLSISLQSNASPTPIPTTQVLTGTGEVKASVPTNGPAPSSLGKKVKKAK